ncbi:MAG: hypothetical protein BWK80_36000 [Desulfobacteraceae bacterium IS3]|nr:MAG: hypothetical protein BWK80_36000 [Desulfobacteraceae bacterium IS3]
MNRRMICRMSKNFLTLTADSGFDKSKIGSDVVEVMNSAAVIPVRSPGTAEEFRIIFYYNSRLYR